MLTDDFKIKTIRQIKIWAWLAAVLPIVGLASIAIIWQFGSRDALDITIVVGEIAMFSVAVVWWWWVIYVLRNLSHQWEKAKSDISEVSSSIREIKTLFREFFDLSRRNDK